MEFFCNRRPWSGGFLREGGGRQEQYRAEPTGALCELKSHGCRCNLFVPCRSAWIFARPCMHLLQAPYEHVFGVNVMYTTVCLNERPKNSAVLQSQLGRSGRRRSSNGFTYVEWVRARAPDPAVEDSVSIPPEL